MNIIELLDRLADLEAKVDVIRLHYQDLREGIIPAEIREKLVEIDVEEQSSMEAAQAGIETLRDQIKQEVLKLGETVSGEYLMAVYGKPRESWDSKGLYGYAVAYPEVKQFLKVGNPTVSFRRKK